MTVVLFTWSSRVITAFRSLTAMEVPYSLGGGVGTEEGKFTFPETIAVSGDAVYVTDPLNHRIQKFTASGGFLAQWTGFGTHDKKKRGASLSGFNLAPGGLLAFGFMPKPLTPEPLVKRVMTHGIGEREFEDCIGIAVSPDGFIFAMDTGSSEVLKFDQGGKLLHRWGQFGGGPGQFWTPLGIDVDGKGFVYVADSGNHRIQKFTPEGTFVTEFGDYGSEDGELNFPIDLAVSSDGTTVYVADTMNNRVQVFKLVDNSSRHKS